MIKEKHNQKEENKGKDNESGKALESPHFIVAHCNVEINEALFNTSFAS